MKLFLISATIVALTWQDIPVTPNVSDLVVLKFSWSRFQPLRAAPPLPSVSEGAPLASPATDPHMSRAISRSGPRRDDPEPIAITRSVQDRTAELRAIEQNAAVDSRPSRDMYIYRIQVRNAANKPITSFVWEYKSPTANDLPARQFFCVAEIKPGKSRNFDVLSRLAPTRVLAASDHPKDNPKLHEQVVLNRIDYRDGFTWQRTYWDPTILFQETRPRVPKGRCVAL